MANQILDLTEFAEKLYLAGNPFAKDILDLIERNAYLEELEDDVQDVLIGCGALDANDTETCMIELLRILLPEVD